ncbi:hypothetical protein BgiBS90_038132 [Biomphalaria glabrata]|nr:hypothetical protein BgiBS90_038132 [Biomphalaria glabrata]
MDGARASDLYRAVSAIESGRQAETSRRGRWGERGSLEAILGGAAPGADLGGSSKYSTRTLKTEVEKGSM